MTTLWEMSDYSRIRLAEIVEEQDLPEWVQISLEEARREYGVSTNYELFRKNADLFRVEM